MVSKSEDGFALKKEVGLLRGVSLIIGICVGFGIYFSPSKTLVATNGSIGLALLVWFTTGIMCTMSALCYCELGGLIKESGLDFAYFNAAYGSTVAFGYQWVTATAARCASNAAKILVFGEYFASLLQSFGVCLENHSPAVKIIPVLVFLLLVAIQMRSVRQSLKLEVAMSAMKFSILAVLAIFGLKHLAPGNSPSVENFSKAFNTEQMQGVSFLGIFSAVYYCTYAYTGWQSLNAVVEEIKDPIKTLTRSIYIAMPLITCGYCFVNVAYFSVLTVEEITSSVAVAATFGEKVFGSCEWFIPSVVCISILGSLNGSYFANARVLFAAARMGHLPKLFSMIHMKYRTLTPSILYQATVTLILVAVGNLEGIMMAYVSWGWTTYGLSACSVLVLRWKHPEADRPYKVPILVPCVVCIFSTACVILPIVLNPNIYLLFGLLYLILGLGLYFIFVVKKRTLPGFNRLTGFIQRILQVYPPCFEAEKITGTLKN